MTAPTSSGRPGRASPDAQSGWRTAIVALMPALRAFARSLCKNASDADDLVQDTLVKAWSKREQFEPGTNLQAWLFTILRNTFYTSVRRRRWEIEDVNGVHAEARSVEPRQEWALTIHALEDALQKLSIEQREVVVLVGGAGLSYEDVAAICGCALGTVKSRLARGRARLAELMQMAPDRAHATPNLLSPEP